MSRIVFLKETPLSERDCERLGFARLAQMGFEIEVWDLSPWLCTTLDSAAGFQAFFPGHRQFPSLKAVQPLVAALQPERDFVIYLAGCDLRTWPLLRALGRVGARLVILANNPIPVQTSSVARRLPWRQVNSYTPYKVLNFIFRTWWPTAWSGIRPARLWILGGARAEAAYRYNFRHLTGPHCEKVWAHALDYDLYLSCAPAERGEPYAVFLDEHFADHYEYALREVDPPLSLPEYDRLMTLYFDRLEQALGLRVVIAVHPSAPYAGQPFGGRPLVQGATAGLVAGSRLVLAHTSTSVGYAVLNRKPVVLLHCQGLRGNPVEAAQAALARSLNIPLHSFDGPFQLPSQQLDEAAYARYQEDYLKRSSSPRLPFWELVGNKLQELNRRSENGP